MELKVQWKAASFVGGGIPASAAAGVLQEIEQRDGQVRDVAVLDASRPVDAVLHPAFEWDDSVAAESYRLAQARQIIRSLVVVNAVKGDTGPPREPVRLYVNVRTAPGAGTPGQYQSLTVAMSNPDTRRRLLQQAVAELNAIRNKYTNLMELAAVFAALDDLEATS